MLYLFEMELNLWWTLAMVLAGATALAASGYARYYFLSLTISFYSIGACFTPVATEWFSLNRWSLPLVALTGVIFPVVFTVAKHTRFQSSVLWVGLVVIQLLLTLLFLVDNFFIFYVVFESLSFPMFAVVAIYGSRPQKVQAAYKFMVYTFLGSIFMLTGLLFLYYSTGTCHMAGLTRHELSPEDQSLLFGLSFVALATKFPMMPLHLWLPEAHVEAPTTGSILLAALLLKTGGYGLVRFVFPLFGRGLSLSGPVLVGLALTSIVLGSTYAIGQVDLKRLVAYSSVAHMNVVALGMLSQVVFAQVGGIYLMLAHGFTSAGLFTGVGSVYDRYRTRVISFYAGLITYMPCFGVLFFGLILGNMSFPFTGGFIGELMIFSEWVKLDLKVAALGLSTVMGSLVYSVWTYNRMFYGRCSPSLRKHADLTLAERSALAVAVAGMIFLGTQAYSVFEGCHW